MQRPTTLAVAAILALSANAAKAQTPSSPAPVVMSLVTLHADVEELAEAFQLLSRSLVLLNRDGVILSVRPTRHPSDYAGCAGTLPDPRNPGADFGCLRAILETAHGHGEDLVVVLGVADAPGTNILACLARGRAHVARAEVDLAAAAREGEEGAEARARLGACLVGREAEGLERLTPPPPTPSRAAPRPRTRASGRLRPRARNR